MRPAERGGRGGASRGVSARPPGRPANAATASGPRASAGPAARRPTRSRRAGEERPGHPVASPRERGETRGETDRQKGAGVAVPRCPGALLPLPPPPPPLPALLVVAEDLVGDFTVENFLVRPQVPRRLLPDERLSVEQRHLPAARVRPASLEQIGGKGKPVRWGAPG